MAETSDIVDTTSPGLAPAGSSWASHLRATLSLGLPLIGAQLAQVAINVTDTVMIGRLGAVELAAAVLATQTFFLVWMFGAGFAQAVMPVAASAAGRGDVRGVRRSVRMGLWVVSVYSALVMLPLWHTEALLLALGQEPNVAALAGGFMRILQWSMLPALFTMGLRSYLGVVGRAHIVLWIVVGGVLVNAAVGYALIFGELGAPRLGMNGAAIASLVTHLAVAVALFAYTFGKADLGLYELYARFWRPDWAAFAEVLRLGWPISMTIIAEVGLFSAASVMMGWLGPVPLAAHGIALQLASIAFMVPLGLSQAATIRVGRAFGGKAWTDLGRAAYSALLIAILVGGVAALFFWAMPGPLLSLYLGAADPNASAVLAVGVPLLAVGAAFQIVDGIQVVASGVLRGLKDTQMPMLIALISYWAVGMPVAYGLGFGLGFGGVGIWAGLAIGLLAAAVLMTLRFANRRALGLTAA